MAHAGRRERSRDIPIDPIPEADEDPGRETCLRLRHHPNECATRGSSKRLDHPAGTGPLAHDLGRARTERDRHADPAQVVAVPAVRRWAQRSAHGDAMARFDERIARQGHRGAGSIGLDAPDRRLHAVPWRADALDRDRPGARSVRDRRIDGRRGPAERHARDDDQRTDRHASRHPRRTRPDDPGDRQRDHRDRQQPDDDRLQRTARHEQRRRDSTRGRPDVTRHVSAPQRGRGSSRTSLRRRSRACAGRRRPQTALPRGRR